MDNNERRNARRRRRERLQLKRLRRRLERLRRRLRADVEQLIGLTELDAFLHRLMPQVTSQRDAYKAENEDALNAGRSDVLFGVVVVFSAFAAAVLDYVLIHDLAEVIVGSRLGVGPQAGIALFTLMLLLLELRTGMELADAIHGLDDEDGEGVRPLVEWGFIALLLLGAVPAAVIGTFMIAGFDGVMVPMLGFELVLSIAAHAVVLRGVESLRRVGTHWTFGRLEGKVQGAYRDHGQVLTRVRGVTVDANDTIVEAGNVADAIDRIAESLN